MSLTKRILLLIALSSLLAACGGGDGSGGNFPTVVPSVPADAIAIDTDNSVATAKFALDVNNTAGLTGVVSSSTSAEHVYSKTKELIRQIQPSADIVTATNHEIPPIPCSDGGNISFNVNGTNASSNGQVVFNSCDEYGVFLNGYMNFSSSNNTTTGDYSVAMNGKITVVTDLESITMEMSFSDQGNYFSGDYSLVMSFSVTGSSIGGFLVETVNPIVGNLNSGSITSGEIMISGSGNAHVHVVYFDEFSANVYYDDGIDSHVDKGKIDF